MKRASLPPMFRDRMEFAYAQDLRHVAIEISDKLPCGIAALAGPERVRVREALWRPGTPGWRRLMAHELAHVAQARRAIAAGAPPRPGITVDPAVESATERAACLALAGRRVPAALLRAGTVALRPTILVEVSSGDGFAVVTANAINKLTHDNAVKLGGIITKYKTRYKTLVADVPASSPHPHARSWLMVERMLSSAHECKIKAAPGTDYGTAYDIEGTEVDPESLGALVINPITLPKALKSSGARAKITWPPVPISTFNLDTSVPQGQRPQTQAPVPAFIILAHELSHADRIMRGTSLMPKKGSKSGMPASAKLGGVEGLASFAVDYEHVEMVGFEAEGHTCLDPDVVTENEMRAEHGIPARTRY